jgi:cell division protein FtsI/penicillin-binding protein 2
MRRGLSYSAFLLFTGACVGFICFKLFPSRLPLDLGFNLAQFKQRERQEELQKNRAFRKKLSHWISSASPCCAEVIFDPDTNEMHQIEYTLDPEIQEFADRLLQAHQPDFGSVVAINATNGDILALSQVSRYPIEGQHLALRNSYPAASVFKIVTAAAAIEKAKLTPNHELLVTGSNSSLNRRHIFNPQPHRWTRRMSLEEAFAQSVNSYFGQLAVHEISPKDLLQYAENFGFNRELQADFSLPESSTLIPSEPNFMLAQMGSGLNRVSRMSPIHAAMIGASLAHEEGKLLAPNLVHRVRDSTGAVIYERLPLILGQTVQPSSLQTMRTLMEATVRRGTSRKQFHTLLTNKKLEGAEFGGKTGSLTGDDPHGRSDWFVGYGIHGDGSRIAIAALTVNEKYWRVKSSYLAQKILGYHFGIQEQQPSVANLSN